jgi:hypothetical protein
VSDRPDGPVEVGSARSRADRAEFIRLPWRIYGGDPCWVPPLRAQVRGLLDRDRHAFYADGEQADVELFLARSGTEVVGRVAAILNHAHNRFHDERVAFFGFFECVDRADVARDLLAAVEQWSRERQATAVRGPMSPSTNYECGLLVEGFDRPPVLMMTYNPRYYPTLVEGSGYTKAKDLLAYYSTVHGSSLDRLKRLAERTRRRCPDLTTRPVNLKEFPEEVRRFQEIYNSAWEKNWGFVPLSDGEIGVLADELKPLVQPELVRFALIDGEPVAFLLVLPDWNPVLAELDGSPWRHPLRAVKHLLRTRPEDMEGIRLITLGVKEEHRKRGLEGVLLAEGLEATLRLGYEWCEYSWILEDNELTKRAVRLMDGEVYKVYRVYEKTL